MRRISASERDSRGGFISKVHEIPWKERDHALFVAEHDDHHLATITDLLRRTAGGRPLWQPA